MPNAQYTPTQTSRFASRPWAAALAALTLACVALPSSEGRPAPNHSSTSSFARGGVPRGGRRASAAGTPLGALKSAPLPPMRYAATTSLLLALGEGRALSQSVVPVRLPSSLDALSAPNPFMPRLSRYLQSTVVSEAWAPPITPSLLKLPPPGRGGDIPGPLAGTAFPVDGRVPGYTVILGTGAAEHNLSPPLATVKALQGVELAFMGEATPHSAMGKPTRRLILPDGVSASYYAAPAVQPLGSAASYVPAALLMWAEGPNTYALYESGYGVPAVPANASLHVLAALANTMSQSHITQVSRVTRKLRLFADTGSDWYSTRFSAPLITETVETGPPGTPGYTTRNRVGIRIVRQSIALHGTRSPFPEVPTASNPWPALSPAIPYLKSAGVPVLLPAVVPLPPGLWPRVEVAANRSGYAMQIAESAVNLPPNTAYQVGQGLGSLFGSVRGSRTPIASGYGVGPPNAPPVPLAAVTGAWLRARWPAGYYHGTVTLGNGLPALLLVTFAGDGDHTTVLFREQGVYYAVGNYHSARQALAMANSMVAVPGPVARRAKGPAQEARIVSSTRRRPAEGENPYPASRL